MLFFSLSVLLLSAIVLGEVARRLGLPSLVGMIVAGAVVGPHGADLLGDELLSLSSQMRTFALVVILMRVGLSLDMGLLRRSGRETVLLSFLPAVCEIVGMVVLAPLFLGITYVEAAIMGCVVAAVSPAIIVPRMIDLIKQKRGVKVAQVVMAASSIDDLFVIILFSVALQMGVGGDFTPYMLLDLPVSLITGVAVGGVLGLLLAYLYRHYALAWVVKVVVLLAVSLLLMGVDELMGDVVAYSPLLSVITIGAVCRIYGTEGEAPVLEAGCDKVWQVAQLLLFSLVGASVDIARAWESSGVVVALLICVLVWRVAGVYLSVMGGGFNMRERLFCMVAYTPKATVQAAIGAVPLAMGLACGEMVLAIAVISIVVTAPLGAFGIDWSARRFLSED